MLGGLSVAEIARALLTAGGDDRQADHPGQGEDPGRRHPLRGPVRRPPARPAGRRAARDLPDLQRGLLGRRRRRATARELSVEAIRLAGLCAADARRAGGARPDRADAAPGLAAPARVAPRRARAAPRPGPRAWDAANRRGRALLDRAVPPPPPPAPTSSRRRSPRSMLRPPGRRDRLAADRRPLRPSSAHPPDAGRGAQPRRRGRHGRRRRGRAAARPRGRPGGGARRVPALPCRPRRPAAAGRESGEAPAAYERALALVTTAAERRFLEERRAELGEATLRQDQVAVAELVPEVAVVESAPA